MIKATTNIVNNKLKLAHLVNKPAIRSREPKSSDPTTKARLIVEPKKPKGSGKLGAIFEKLVHFPTP